jgi:large subunit ribosomal protein L25
VIDAVRRWCAPAGRPRPPQFPRPTAAARPITGPVPYLRSDTVSEVKIPAAQRTEFGKGAARRLRRAHQVPAVVYGHGTDPVHVSLPGHATMLALKKNNVLLTLDIDGKSTLALPKAVQRDPLKGTIEHVDLLIVRRGEKVTVDVSVHVIGEAAVGTLVNTTLNTLAVEVEATAIPQQIEVDVTGAEAGTLFHAGQITLPAGATLVTDDDALVVLVSGATEDMEAEAEAEGEPAAEAEAATAEA